MKVCAGIDKRVLQGQRLAAGHLLQLEKRGGLHLARAAATRIVGVAGLEGACLLQLLSPGIGQGFPLALRGASGGGALKLGQLREDLPSGVRTGGQFRLGAGIGKGEGEDESREQRGGQHGVNLMKGNGFATHWESIEAGWNNAMSTGIY